MTQNYSPGVRRTKVGEDRGRRTGALSLRQFAPQDWHRDPPAYAGDPYMDWESTHERPPEPRAGIWESKPRRSGAR